MKVLEGIRVIDWSQWQAGPVAGAMLADLGAEVIHVEMPVTGDPGRGLFTVAGTDSRMPGGRTAYFELSNRHKRSITLSLKHQQGRQVMYDLVVRSDVFVQNFRLGVAERLGLGYEELRQHNPRLIYASVTGYGERGPERESPSFDALAMARSGIMWNVGEPEMPPLRIEGGVTDQLSGMVSAYGVLAAIIARERFGIGQKVITSQLMSMMALQGMAVGLMLMKGEPSRRQSRKSTRNPLWNSYRARDGKWFQLAMLQSDRHWPHFCRVLGSAGARLSEDTRFANEGLRVEHRRELIDILDGVFDTKTMDEWAAVFRSEPEIFWQPISDVTDLRDDPQVQANGYVVHNYHPVFGETSRLSSVIELSETPADTVGVAPELGQDTERILMDVCGYSWERVAELRRMGVV